MAPASQAQQQEPLPHQERTGDIEVCNETRCDPALHMAPAQHPQRVASQWPSLLLPVRFLFSQEPLQSCTSARTLLGQLEAWNAHSSATHASNTHKQHPPLGAVTSTPFPVTIAHPPHSIAHYSTLEPATLATSAFTSPAAAPSTAHPQHLPDELHLNADTLGPAPSNTVLDTMSPAIDTLHAPDTSFITSNPQHNPLPPNNSPSAPATVHPYPDEFPASGLFSHPPSPQRHVDVPRDQNITSVADQAAPGSLSDALQASPGATTAGAIPTHSEAGEGPPVGDNTRQQQDPACGTHTVDAVDLSTGGGGMHTMDTAHTTAAAAPPPPPPLLPSPCDITNSLHAEETTPSSPAAPVSETNLSAKSNPQEITLPVFPMLPDTGKRTPPSDGHPCTTTVSDAQVHHAPVPSLPSATPVEPPLVGGPENQPHPPAHKQDSRPEAPMCAPVQNSPQLQLGSETHAPPPAAQQQLVTLQHPVLAPQPAESGRFGTTGEQQWQSPHITLPVLQQQAPYLQHPQHGVQGVSSAPQANTWSHQYPGQPTMQPGSYPQPHPSMHGMQEPPHFGQPHAAYGPAGMHGPYGPQPGHANTPAWHQRNPTTAPSQSYAQPPPQVQGVLPMHQQSWTGPSWHHAQQHDANQHQPWGPQTSAPQPYPLQPPSWPAHRPPAQHTTHPAHIQGFPGMQARPTPHAAAISSNGDVIASSLPSALPPNQQQLQASALMQPGQPRPVLATASSMQAGQPAAALMSRPMPIAGANVLRAGYKAPRRTTHPAGDSNSALLTVADRSVGARKRDADDEDGQPVLKKAGMGFASLGSSLGTTGSRGQVPDGQGRKSGGMRVKIGAPMVSRSAAEVRRLQELLLDDFQMGPTASDGTPGSGDGAAVRSGAGSRGPGPGLPGPPGFTFGTSAAALMKAGDWQQGGGSEEEQQQGGISLTDDQASVPIPVSGIGAIAPRAPATVSPAGTTALPPAEEELGGGGFPAGIAHAAPSATQDDEAEWLMLEHLERAQQGRTDLPAGTAAAWRPTHMPPSDITHQTPQPPHAPAIHQQAQQQTMPPPGMRPQLGAGGVATEAHSVADDGDGVAKLLPMHPPIHPPIHPLISESLQEDIRNILNAEAEAMHMDAVGAHHPHHSHHQHHQQQPHQQGQHSHQAQPHQHPHNQQQRYHSLGPAGMVKTGDSTSTKQTVTDSEGVQAAAASALVGPSSGSIVCGGPGDTQQGLQVDSRTISVSDMGGGGGLSSGVTVSGGVGDGQDVVTEPSCVIDKVGPGSGSSVLGGAGVGPGSSCTTITVSAAGGAGMGSGATVSGVRGDHLHTAAETSTDAEDAGVRSAAMVAAQPPPALVTGSGRPVSISATARGAAMRMLTAMQGDAAGSVQAPGPSAAWQSPPRDLRMVGGEAAGLEPGSFGSGLGMCGGGLMLGSGKQLAVDPQARAAALAKLGAQPETGNAGQQPPHQQPTTHVGLMLGSGKQLTVDPQARAAALARLAADGVGVGQPAAYTPAGGDPSQTPAQSAAQPVDAQGMMSAGTAGTLSGGGDGDGAMASVGGPCEVPKASRLLSSSTGTGQAQQLPVIRRRRTVTVRPSAVKPMSLVTGSIPPFHPPASTAHPFQHAATYTVTTTSTNKTSLRDYILSHLPPNTTPLPDHLHESHVAMAAAESITPDNAIFFRFPPTPPTHQHTTPPPGHTSATEQLDAPAADPARAQQQAGAASTATGTLPPAVTSPGSGGAVHEGSGHGGWGVVEAHAALIAGRADPVQATQQWVANHYRWVVWKLAGYQRVTRGMCEPEQRLTRDNVLVQLQHRYQREHVRHAHSALASIMRGEVPPTRPLVVVVASLHPPAPVTSDNHNHTTGGGDVAGVPVGRHSSPGVGGQGSGVGPNWSPVGSVRANDGVDGVMVIEVCDGWYPARVELDGPLAQLVRHGRIKAGCKLRLSGCVRVGGDNNPLDSFHVGTRLRVAYNSCSPVSWDTPMGWCRPPITLRPLSTIICEGGPAQHIVVLVQAVYAMHFWKRSNGGTSLFRTYRQQEADMHKQNARYQELCGVSDNVPSNGWDQGMLNRSRDDRAPTPTYFVRLSTVLPPGQEPTGAELSVQALVRVWGEVDDSGEAALEEGGVYLVSGVTPAAVKSSLGASFPLVGNFPPSVELGTIKGATKWEKLGPATQLSDPAHGWHMAWHGPCKALQLHHLKAQWQTSQSREQVIRASTTTGTLDRHGMRVPGRLLPCMWPVEFDFVGTLISAGPVQQEQQGRLGLCFQWLFLVDDTSLECEGVGGVGPQQSDDQQAAQEQKPWMLAVKIIGPAESVDFVAQPGAATSPGRAPAAALCTLSFRRLQLEGCDPGERCWRAVAGPITSHKTLAASSAHSLRLTKWCAQQASAVELAKQTCMRLLQ